MFEAFPKISRLSRPIVISEKIDGTNAQILIRTDECLSFAEYAQAVTEVDGFLIYAGSRKRYITPGNDNFGFAAWVKEHAEELVTLGEGRHYGEWWGKGIQRGYDLDEKRFSLFNSSRWDEETKPSCCSVVPVLRVCDVFSTYDVDSTLMDLMCFGSSAAPGYMNPEGVVVYHPHGNVSFKKTIKDDELPKGIPA